jgi:membrane fusion protein, multidrug efflux system
MKTSNLILVAIAAVLLNACQKPDPLEAKKTALKQKKEELQKIRTSITELEQEIGLLDPDFGKKNRKATLITTSTIETKTFEHYLEVSGSVKSRRNVLISAENMGSIDRILAKEGFEVKKGQLIMSMDTELYQRTLDQLQTEYSLAKTMFEKQSNLWKQNIGTEVQYLESKNRKESLENQIANVKTQIEKSQIRAPFEGTIEEVMVKEGEMAQPGSPLVRIVNHRDMYVKADLSESYVGNFKKGDKVSILFPSINRTIESTISSVGQVIDEKNRTFAIEALLPLTDFTIKPNLIVTVKIMDYKIADAVVIPSKLIQRDNHGEFVFIAEMDGEELVARKVQVERGMTYKNSTVINDGLKGAETLINEGFRDVAEGTKLKVVENVL